MVGIYLVLEMGVSLISLSYELSLASVLWLIYVAFVLRDGGFATVLPLKNLVFFFHVTVIVIHLLHLAFLPEMGALVLFPLNLLK